MTNDDTLALLKECDAGVKMATASLDDVREHVETPELRAILNTSRQQHELIGREVQDVLEKNGGHDRDPHPIARKMAKMKTNATMKKNDNTEKAAAKIVVEGCRMGAQSLRGYLDEYKGADVPSRALCRTLVAVEEQLANDASAYL